MELENENTISLFFNVDGLPLYKGCSKQFWPILGKIFNRKHSPSCSAIFVIAIFCGSSKPASVEEYLHDFIAELSHLMEVGLTFHGKHYAVDIVGFACDAPARAYIKCIKGHTGYFGCEKCEQHGERVDRVMTFPELNAPKRSDESFKNQSQKGHHKGTSPLLALNIGLVTGFPLDYMHLICIGVTKKLLIYWIHGEYKVKISATQIQVLSELLLKSSTAVCSEFSRKPRSFQEVDRWKAVEFRNFLLYLGPVVLRSVLCDDLYHHFMLLSVATTVMLSETLSRTMLTFASKLLKSFVSEACGLYGHDSLVYNMHSLVHLPDDVAHFGTLDRFSCFSFESKLGVIKKQLRSGARPLAQFCRRHSELSSQKPVTCSKLQSVKTHSGIFTVGEEHRSCQSASPDDRQFYVLACGQLSFDTRRPADRYALLRYATVVEIHNIVYDVKDNDVLLVCRQFSVASPFYTYPCDSSQLDVWKVTGLTSSYHSYRATDIQSKCMLLQRKDYYVALPLMHE